MDDMALKVSFILFLVVLTFLFAIMKGDWMKCDDNKVLAITYMLTETLNHKELLKVIMLLISEYFRERDK